MDDYRQIHHRMMQIQQAQLQRTRASGLRATRDSELATVMEWVRPVVTQFVAGDSALDVQSMDASNVFVGYALISVCRIRISLEDAHARIEVRGDEFVTSKSFDLKIEKGELTKWLGQALLDWYESLF